MKRFCECHHPDCNICKICNKYEQRITELETANKGLQITLLDANEKEKELQLRNAMLVDALNRAKSIYDNADDTYCNAIDVWRYMNSIEGVIYKALSTSAPAQSAVWLENSHREWMKGLPIAGTYTVSLFRGHCENAEFQPSIDFTEGTHKLYTIPPIAEERKD